MHVIVSVLLLLVFELVSILLLYFWIFLIKSVESLQSHFQTIYITWKWDFERQVLEHCWEAQLLPSRGRHKEHPFNDKNQEYVHHVHPHIHPHINIRYLHMCFCSLSISFSLSRSPLPSCTDFHQNTMSVAKPCFPSPSICLMPPPDDVLLRLQPLFQGQLEEFVMEIQLGKCLVQRFEVDGIVDAPQWWFANNNPVPLIFKTQKNAEKLWFDKGDLHILVFWWCSKLRWWDYNGLFTYYSYSSPYSSW